MTAPTLTEFLLARIGDDECAIRTAWHSDVTFTPLSVTRLLNDCDARRAIVRDSSFRESQNPARLSLFGERILGTLAAVYADHPDYDEAWRP